MSNTSNQENLLSIWGRQYVSGGSHQTWAGGHIAIRQLLAPCIHVPPRGYIPTSFTCTAKIAFALGIIFNPQTTGWLSNCIKQSIRYFLIFPCAPIFWKFQRWFLVTPTYISDGWLCESASVTWLKKAWMRACRSGHQANVSIREYKKGGEPSPRAHYRVVPIAPAHFVSLPPHVNSWQIFTTQSFQPNSPYLTREL